jgi:hypothetical protein
MLGVTAKAVALVVLHAKLMTWPLAVTEGVAEKLVMLGPDEEPPPPLLPPLPLPPLPEPEVEDPPPHATVKPKQSTLANNHALRKANIPGDLPVDPSDV